MAEIKKGNAQLMWGGLWVDLGEVEFTVTENNTIEKIISYTPRTFEKTGEGDSETASDPG